MNYARRRCSRNPGGASPTHRMVTDNRALCSAHLMRPTEYWEEMEGDPAGGFVPIGGSGHSTYCQLCWRIEEARK